MPFDWGSRRSTRSVFICMPSGSQNWKWPSRRRSWRQSTTPIPRRRQHLEAHARRSLLAAAGPGHRGRLLCTPLVVGRDRLWRSRVPAGICAPRERQGGALGERRAALRMGTAPWGPIRRIPAGRRRSSSPRPTRTVGDALMREPIFGRFDPPRSSDHLLGPVQRLKTPMRHYRESEEVDVCIVGVGSAGGVLLQRLSRAGLRVVGIESGPFWDVERDWVSDEAGSHKLYWNDLRITAGANPITLGENNSGHGVGGGSVHWAAFAPRFHPSDFHIYELDGVGVDWPFRYDVIRPYYEMLEREMPVAGPARFPWGYPHSYPYGPHPSAGVGCVD